MTGQPSEAKPSLSTTNGNLTEDGFNTVPAVEGTDVKLTCKASSPTNNFTHSIYSHIIRLHHVSLMQCRSWCSHIGSRDLRYIMYATLHQLHYFVYQGSMRESLETQKLW